jgi:hypothetical protein
VLLADSPELQGQVVLLDIIGPMARNYQLLLRGVFDIGESQRLVEEVNLQFQAW